MPGRRVHIVCSYMYARHARLSLADGAHEAINTLIDHPRQAWQLLERAAAIICSQGEPWECNALTAVLNGFRVKSVATHDWSSPRGAMLLRSVARALYGRGAEVLVSLHYALDCIEQGGPVCSLAGRSELEWAERNCASRIRSKQ